MYFEHKRFMKKTSLSRPKFTLYLCLRNRQTVLIINKNSLKRASVTTIWWPLQICNNFSSGVGKANVKNIEGEANLLRAQGATLNEKAHAKQLRPFQTWLFSINTWHFRVVHWKIYAFSIFLTFVNYYNLSKNMNWSNAAFVTLLAVVTLILLLNSDGVDAKRKFFFRTFFKYVNDNDEYR